VLDHDAGVDLRVLVGLLAGDRDPVAFRRLALLAQDAGDVHRGAGGERRQDRFGRARAGSIGLRLVGVEAQLEAGPGARIDPEPAPWIEHGGHRGERGGHVMSLAVGDPQCA